MAAFGEIIRFGLVGGAATAVHAGTGLGLEHFAGVAPWAANIAAFCVASVVSYLGNTILTFRVKAADKGAFARYIALALAGFATNQGIVVVFTERLGWSYAASLAVALTIVPVATFVLAKYWALAERKAG